MSDFQRSSSLQRSQSYSHSFRTVSRDKQASWGRRFVRDHNDLFYDVNPQSISNRLKNRNKCLKRDEKKKLQSKQKSQKYQYIPFKDKKSPYQDKTTMNISSGLRPEEYLQGLQMFDKDSLRKDTLGIKKHSEQQGNRKRCSSGKQTMFQKKEMEDDHFGLSRFEFNQTLKGKIKNRLNHHIDFNKIKTQKDSNDKIIWHNSQNQLPDSRIKSATGSNHAHSFKNYSPHNLFIQDQRFHESNGSGNGGMLDKFYQIGLKQFKAAKTLKFDMMSTRKKPKASQAIEYRTQSFKTIEREDKKVPLFGRSQSKRELRIGRQVIDPRRGCYR